MAVALQSTDAGATTQSPASPTLRFTMPSDVARVLALEL